jgi:hypothetical protein
MKRAALGIAAVAIAAAVAAPTIAGAVGSGSSSSSAATTTPQQQQKADRQSAYEAALAKALGIDVAKLQAAEQKARNELFLAQLDEMVAAGRFSKAEADALRKAAQQGKLDEQLKTIQRTRLKARLDAAVKNGIISQDQADAILKRFDANDGTGRAFGFGHRHGFGGPGFGGHGSGFGGPGPGKGDLGPPADEPVGPPADASPTF